MRLLPAFLILSVQVFGAAEGASPRSRQALARDLEHLAQITAVMVDGDLCQRIMTERALEKMFRVDPKDQWAGSDNFDVNAEPYIQTKKTLQRLARLLPYPVDCNLWMPFKDRPGKIQILIRNRYEMSQFWPWGTLIQDATPEMLEVLSKGATRTVAAKLDFVSVLAPVRNSLGDVVALVEVVSRLNLDSQENVK